LDEFLEFGGLVGCFTDDLYDDVIEGGLGIDVRNADFAVLEIQFFDTLLDSLQLLDCTFPGGKLLTYTSTDRNGSYLSFKTRDELGSLAIEELDAISQHRMA
jgi:hypothetical protein